MSTNNCVEAAHDLANARNVVARQLAWAYNMYGAGVVEAALYNGYTLEFILTDDFSDLFLSLAIND